MHLFYQQAFEVLFERHDRSKGVYTRKLQSGLDIHEFQSVFAQFCASSYAEEDFSFGDNSINTYAAEALSYEDRSVRPKDFVRDLTEAVCLLQRDGPEYSFVHRSFQEYFTSVFINSMQPADYREAVDSLLRRSSGDSVITMLVDKDRNKFDRYWLIPTVDQIVRENLSPAAFTKKVYDGIWWRSEEDSAFILSDLFDANRYFTITRFGGTSTGDRAAASAWNPLQNLSEAFAHRDLAGRLKGLIKKVDIERLKRSAETTRTVFGFGNYPDLVIEEMIKGSILENYTDALCSIREAAEVRLQQKSAAALSVFRRKRKSATE